MTNASSRVLPLIYAKGVISIVPRSIKRAVCSLPRQYLNHHKEVLNMDQLFSFKSPGKKPSIHQASTAGLVKTILFTVPFLNCFAA